MLRRFTENARMCKDMFLKRRGEILPRSKMFNPLLKKKKVITLTLNTIIKVIKACNSYFICRNADDLYSQQD